MKLLQKYSFKFQSPKATDLTKENADINDVKMTDNSNQQVVSTETMKTAHEKAQKKV